MDVTSKLSSVPLISTASPHCRLLAERRLYVRERADGLYYVFSYLLAKIIEEVLLAAVLSVIFSLYVFYGVQYQGSFGLYWIVYLLTLANGIGGLRRISLLACVLL